MAPYPAEGTLVTDKREVAISETWDSQTEWEAYQSITDCVITNGAVLLEEQSAIPDSGLEHDYNVLNISASDGASISSVTDDAGTNDLSGNATYVESGPNGMPVLEHDGTDDELRGGQFVQSNTQVFSVHFVTLTNANDTASAMLDQGGSNGGYQLAETGDLAPSGVSGGPQVAPWTGNLDVVSVRRDDVSGDDTNVLFNGAESNYDITDANAPADEAGIGSRGGEWFAQMQWGRLLWYSDHQSDSDFAQTHSALRDEWGV